MVSEEEERAELIKRIKMSQALNTNRYSYKPPNPYKTALVTIFGLLGIGSFGLLLWLVGRKSKKEKCECRD